MTGHICLFCFINHHSLIFSSLTFGRDSYYTYIIRTFCVFWTCILIKSVIFIPPIYILIVLFSYQKYICLLLERSYYHILFHSKFCRCHCCFLVDESLFKFPLHVWNISFFKFVGKKPHYPTKL